MGELEMSNSAESEAVQTTLATIAADTQSWDRPADVVKRLGGKMGWYQLIDSLRTAPAQFWQQPDRLRQIAVIFNVAAELGDRARVIPFEVGDIAHILGTLCGARVQEFEEPNRTRPAVPGVPARDDLLKQVFEAYMRQLNLNALGWREGSLPLTVCATVKNVDKVVHIPRGIATLWEVVGHYRSLLPQSTEAGQGKGVIGLTLFTDGEHPVGTVDPDGVIRMTDAQLQASIEIMAATDNGRRYVLDGEAVASAVRHMLRAKETLVHAGSPADMFTSFWQRHTRVAWGADSYIADPGKRLSIHGDGYLAASKTCWKIATGKDAPDATE